MLETVFDYVAIWMGIPCGCVAALVGWKMFLNHRRDIHIGQNASVENIGGLCDEMLCLHDGLEDVRERLEFHERRLAKAEEETYSTPV